MRVAVDARAFFWTGVGRYVRNILREYAALGHEVVVLVAESDLERVREVVRLWGVDWQLVAVEGSYYSWREQVIFYYQLQRLDVDLVHFVHFNVPVLYRRPYVVTIHDVTRFWWPAQVTADWRRQVVYEWVLARAVRGALGIICVSKTTQEELGLLSLHAKCESQVVLEGIEEEMLEPANASERRAWREYLGWEGRYLLYVGVWMNHKNLRRLLMAFKKVAAENEGVRLVITGVYREGYVPVAKLVAGLGLQEKVLLPGFVPAELLSAVYAEAEALVFPSLYEGFGLPLLEAAAQRCAVMTSLASSMPEVMGEGAYYVNPDSITSIADGMQKVLQDEGLRSLLQEAGGQRLNTYSWRKAATQTWQIYKDVLG